MSGVTTNAIEAWLESVMARLPVRYETDYEAVARVTELAGRPMDVQRLAQALDLCGIGFVDGHPASTWAETLAAEYRRLLSSDEELDADELHVAFLESLGL